MAQQTPSYLLSAHGPSVCLDAHCPEAVKMNAETGRWFVTMGHPAFNSPANNRSGYSSKAVALGAIRRSTRTPQQRTAAAAERDAQDRAAIRAAQERSDRERGPFATATVIDHTFNSGPMRVALAVDRTLEAAFEDGENRESLADFVGLPALATADFRKVAAGEAAAEYEISLTDGTVYVVTVEAKMKRSR